MSEILAEDTPDENKSVSGVQSTSKDCDLPRCTAPAHINMQCMGACNLPSKARLTYPGCNGLTETVRRKLSLPACPEVNKVFMHPQ